MQKLTAPENMTDSLKSLEHIEFEGGRSLWNDAWIRLKRNRLAMFGFWVMLFLVSISLITPWLAPYGYEIQDLELGASGPSLAHWLGTDTLGRDLLTRLMYGGRVSLLVGFAATAVSLVVGVLWGIVAGYTGGSVDAVMMRIVDILYALPFMIFVILLMVVFGQSFLLLFLAIGLVEWLTMARIVRGQVQALRRQDFVSAAIVTGLSSGQIMRRHILPNIMGPVIVYITLTIPAVMLFEAFLSFLGLGVQPPQSSWGVLIATGVETMEEYPWLLIFPGLALSITLFALNFLGDGLRDALDPRSASGAGGIYE
ncbi:MAG: ABC transporter permease [Arenicellales bacterium]